jgi:UDP-N-acetylmuramyl-tripeptide synthetase
MGYRFDDVTAALQTLEPVPGRLQPVRAGSAHEPVAVVDYAHSPDALAHALDALRPLAAAREGRLWCVFGAGGDRDAGKRPLMAQVAQRLADHVVITSDNPRSESPELILDDIARGLTQAPWLREADRAAAISTVIAAAQPCDVVLIAGKGHESYQEIAGVQHPFDDREHAARALAARPAHGGADV